MRPTPRRRLLGAVLAAALSALTLQGISPPAHAATPDATASDPAQKTLLDEDRASQQAQATGEAVDVEAATTPTELEVANPDGTFTLTQSVAPVRKYTGGAWKKLDATLVRHGDGTLAPTLSTSGLTLSGGGDGPLAMMKDLGKSLSLSVPDTLGTLPDPVLDGPSATYPAVLPSVDLKITADEQGGFTEVLVVKTAQAAANPALATITFPTEAKHVSPATDGSGNFTAKDPAGRTVFAAPAPRMWDSATPAAASTTASTARSKSVAAGVEADGNSDGSSAEAPGIGAHVAPVVASYTDGSIQLTPDADLLTGSSTVFPLYIDPSYTAAGGKLTGWTWVSSSTPNTSNWGTTDPAGLHVGYQGWETPYHKSRTYARLSVDGRLYGATVLSSTFYATETYAPSCTATPVEVWQTGSISSATTWAHQPSWTTQLDSQTEAHGYSSSCPAKSIGWDVKSAMQGVASAGTASTITLGLRAGEADEDNKYGWKKFDHATMSMTTTYDHKPKTPTPLTTSPATTCTSSIKTVGNGDVTLYAKVADADGGTLKTTLNITKTTGGAQIAKPVVTAASGTNAVYVLKKSVLQAAAGTSVLGVSWNATVSDGTYSSATSATCKFNFDASRPGAPQITDSASFDCGTSDSTVTYQVGVPAAFTLTPNGSGTASYLYQLNGATPAATSETSIGVKPTRGTNVLTVTAVSPGGNIGDTANCVIIASPAATAADGDLTGDGLPDLTGVGAQANLPRGLWLAHGASAGQLNATASNLGVQGTGANSAGSPADWNGTQAITGHFNTGAGLNDVLDYDPATRRGSILYGSGDGSPLQPFSGDQANVNPTVFTDQDDHAATSLANGGGLYNLLNGNPDTGYPDLLMVNNGQLWDEPSNPVAGAFGGIDNALLLSATNPSGTGDWSGWNITTSLIGGQPALFARNNTGGQLYYYSPTDLQNLAYGSTVTPIQAAGSGFPSSAVPLIEAADLNADNTPDLWTTTSSGVTTALLFNGTTLTAQPAQALVTDSHTWPLADATDGTATTAADTTGTTALPLTGAGAGATWDSDDDLYSPTLALDGSSTGSMTSAAALSMSSAFTLSAWAKPAALGGVVASQDGTTNSGFFLYAQSNGQWAFCLATSDTTRANDCITGGTAVVGQWAHLTVTYDPATKAMTLYLDDRAVARGSHTAVSSTLFKGKFTLGNVLANGAHSSFYKGSLSTVQAWNSTALTTTQIAVLGNLSQAKSPYTYTDLADFNGDTNPDVVAEDSTGELWLYPGNGSGGWSTGPLHVGSGFTGYTFAGIADFNKDGYADVIAMDAAGGLWLYPGNAVHDLSRPRIKFISGWSGYAFAGVADFNKDGKPDLIGRHPDGTLKLFPGTGSGAGIGAGVQIGTGFGSYTLAGVADFDHDGNLDVIARDSAGALWNYPGNGSNDVSSGPQIGTGWNGYTIAGIADFNTDGNLDAIAREDDTGILWFYPRSATSWGARIQIGSSW
ncbi:FG-GAP-like repeat-containing protein [Streptomyces beijiangensis]|uniref:VCBS repeat-containing protein n=1 Tax=Streptomyces beijiangensis TaxID=163361 RepID=A0A939FAU8_9ACTN|nr:FG-GAP-like repeat-containing protein [Streptomyces beijiangensis]MBO0514779.1 VCBS repeat-containing protein [Streptomyces beijiangensis]